jgi:protocatechuate 3,4-dioxygenase beta subunit
MSQTPDDNDDLPVGHLIDRREAVRLLALSGAALVVGCKPSSGSSGAALGDSASSASVTTASTSTAALPACVAKPELTVGPYFLDKQLDRSDIRVEPSTKVVKPGAPLALTFNVRQIANGQCTPLEDAMVDVWHCDAAGQYSGFNDNMVGFNTVGRKFLRGYQVTDAAGVARFTTVYPGWYRGRTVHIHFKIRTPAEAAMAGDQAKAYEFTSQLFFDDAFTDSVFTRQPYAAKGKRDLRNSDDGIFQQSGGALTLNVAQSGDGYAGTFDVGLDLSDASVGKADRGGGPEGGPGGPGGPPRGRPPRA